jgi:hypothetical protein
MQVSGQLHAPAALCPEETGPGTSLTGSFVGPRAGLYAIEKRKTHALVQISGCPARSLVAISTEGVLRRTFGPKTRDVMRGWRQMHNRELGKFYSSPNIIRTIK